MGKKFNPINYNINGDEVFLPVPEDKVPGIKPNTYYVSNYGRVYNSETGNYIGSYDEDGYLRSVVLTDKGYVSKGNHTLMMLAFNPLEHYDPAVDVPNHLDGIPDHNTLDNLEWTDVKGNSEHAVATGLHKIYGEDNPNSKLSESDVRKICELISTGQYYDKEIAAMFNVSYTNISDIHSGKIWTQISKDYDLSAKKYLSLTPESAEEVCKAIQSGRYSNAEIARMFGVTTGAIQGIRNGTCWKDISQKYDMTVKKPGKFTEEEIREICEKVQSGTMFDTEIATEYGTTPTYLRDLRIGKVWKDVTKDYDMTVRKKR